jgi:hypothetical protein
MNKEQTKEAIAIMQAYVEGKEIQYKKKDEERWLEPAVGGPIWNWYLTDYRIKLEVVSYRRFLFKHSDLRYTVETVTQAQNKVPSREGWHGFIRWIDNDWIEEVV